MSGKAEAVTFADSQAIRDAGQIIPGQTTQPSSSSSVAKVDEAPPGSYSQEDRMKSLLAEPVAVPVTAGASAETASSGSAPMETVEEKKEDDKIEELLKQIKEDEAKDPVEKMEEEVEEKKEEKKEEEIEKINTEEIQDEGLRQKVEKLQEQLSKARSAPQEIAKMQQEEMRDMLQKHYMPLMQELAKDSELKHYLTQMQQGAETLERNPNPETFALAKGMYATASRVYELKKENDRTRKEKEELQAMSIQRRKEEYQRKRRYSELIDAQQKRIKAQEEELHGIKTRQPLFQDPGELVSAGASRGGGGQTAFDQWAAAKKRGPVAQAAFEATMADAEKKGVPRHIALNDAVWRSEKTARLWEMRGASNPSELTWRGVGPYPNSPNYPPEDRARIQKSLEFDRWNQANWLV